MAANLAQAGPQDRGACGCPPPFLPRRAICNLENLEGEKNKPPLGPKDAWWGRWARIWGCLASAGVGQGGYFSDQKGVHENVTFFTRSLMRVSYE